MGASNVIANTGTGAAAGASVGGPWGAVIGGGVGLLTGLFGEYENAKSERERQRAIQRAADKMNVDYSVMQNMINEYYKNNQSIGTQQDVAAYRNLVDTYNPQDYVYNYEDFDNDYDVENYYAPNRQAIIDKTTDQLQHTAAGAGIGRGTGAANQIATGVAEKSESLYRDALNAMNQDRQFAYNLWNSKIQNAQNRLNALNQNTQTQLNMYGNLAEDYQNYNQQQMQTQLDLAAQKANNNMNIALASI